MEKTKELKKKEKQINEILFKQIDRNTLLKKREQFEDLAVYILDSVFVNYPWSTAYEPLSHTLYIFNSAILPTGHETINILNMKNLDVYYDAVINVAVKLLKNNDLPKEGNPEQIELLTSKLKKELRL